MNAPQTNAKVFGYDFDDILRAQQRKGSLSKPIPASAANGDYGFDPIGDGTVRMVPSGEIVELHVALQRLGRTGGAR